MALAETQISSKYFSKVQKVVHLFLYSANDNSCQFDPKKTQLQVNIQNRGGGAELNIFYLHTAPIHNFKSIQFQLNCSRGRTELSFND